jgi:ribosomal protein L31E
MEEVTEKLMEELQSTVNTRNFKTLQIKNFKKAQKQVNELREDFNKHQSETKVFTF